MIVGILLTRQLPASDSRGPHHKSSQESIRGIFVGVERSLSSSALQNIRQLAEARGLKFKKKWETMDVLYFTYPKEIHTLDGSISACLEMKKISGVRFCEFDRKVKLNADGELPCNQTFGDNYPQIYNLNTLAKAIIDSQCEIVPSWNGEKYAKDFFSNRMTDSPLSIFWAQELTGADLLQEQLKNTKIYYPKNLLASIDGDVEDHGVCTTNLIAGNAPTALFLDLGLKYVNAIFFSDFLDFAEKSKNSNEYPMYINNSMDWGDDVPISGLFNGAVTYQAFEVLSKGNSLAIVASGNEAETHSSVGDLKIKASEKINVLLVGSSDPNGFPSDFSQKASKLAILAPSNVELTTAGRDGKYKAFSGTSGAAPQVTAALAAFTAISGYQLSRDEALMLLAKTATKSANTFENPPEDGPGILNTYKIGQVASRLKEQCKSPVNLADLKQCFHDALQDEKTYHFDVDNNIGDIKSIFPDCFGSTLVSGRQPSSCERAAAFRKLRAQALLTGDSLLYAGISCIYESNGFRGNARFYSTLSFFSNATEYKNQSQLLVSMIKQRLPESTDFVVKEANKITPTDKKAISDLSSELINAFSDGNPEVRVEAAKVLVQSHLLLDNQPTVEHQAISALIDSLKDPSYMIRADAAWDMSYIKSPNDYIVSALESKLTDSSALVRLWAVTSLMFINLEHPDRKTMSVLLEALKDSDSDVRARAFEALTLLEGTIPGAFNLWIIYSTDKNMNQSQRDQIHKILYPNGENSSETRRQGGRR